MKKLSLALITLTLSATAHADGFVCQTVEGDLNVKVYNHTQADFGTRTAAVMVLSDPSVGVGNKTIARFTEVNETLTNVGASYEANVDLRFNDSGRKGELMAGTKLGYLKTITLDVAFSYNHPVAAGTTLLGEVSLLK